MQFPSSFPSMYKNDDTQHRGRWICISCCRGRSESCIFFPAFMYSVFGNCKRNCAKILCKLTLRRKMLHCYCSSTFYQPQGWSTYSADPRGKRKRGESWVTCIYNTYQKIQTDGFSYFDVCWQSTVFLPPSIVMSSLQ